MEPVALGGVVPFLSFFVERPLHRAALADLARLEAQKAARSTAAAPAPQEA